MKAYKLVSCIEDDDNNYHSLTILGSALKYTVGEFTEPLQRCGPIACFSREGFARHFLSYIPLDLLLHNRIALFICEIEKSGGAYLSTAVGSSVPLESLPHGTWLAKSLKLENRMGIAHIGNKKETGKRLVRWEPEL